MTCKPGTRTTGVIKVSSVSGRTCPIDGTHLGTGDAFRKPGRSDEQARILQPPSRDNGSSQRPFPALGDIMHQDPTSGRTHGDGRDDRGGQDHPPFIRFGQPAPDAEQGEQPLQRPERHLACEIRMPGPCPKTLGDEASLGVLGCPGEIERAFPVGRDRPRDLGGGRGLFHVLFVRLERVLLVVRHELGVDGQEGETGEDEITRDQSKRQTRAGLGGTRGDEHVVIRQ